MIQATDDILVFLYVSNAVIHFAIVAKWKESAITRTPLMLSAPWGLVQAETYFL